MSESDDIQERAARALEGVTEGPWFYGHPCYVVFPFGRTLGKYGDHGMIADTCRNDPESDTPEWPHDPNYSECKANARFIAAAPGLVRDLMALVEQQRRTLACMLLWSEDAEYFVAGVEPHTPSHVARFHSIMAALTEQHSGDCTRESHTCSRCHAERLLRDADDLLALARGRDKEIVRLKVS